MVEMPTMVTVGSFFISCSPSLALTLLVLYPNSHLLVLSILGAFMWCLAMMLAGTIWLMIPPLRDNNPWSLFVAVTMQELMRLVLFLIFRMMSRRGDGVEAFLRPGAKNQMLSGMSIGVGYALLASLVNYYAVVIDNFASNTAIYTDNCTINFIVAGASNALAFNLLHICLGVFLWPAYSEDPSYVKVLCGYAIHLGVSMATLGGRVGCHWSLGLVFGLVGIVFAFTLAQCRRRVRKEAL